ncbi:MAG: hypothetical protein UZ14_CFX002001159, partial [Chloroflexi bacterium OLB14]
MMFTNTIIFLLVADFSLLSSIIDGTYSNYGFACTTNNETD